MPGDVSRSNRGQRGNGTPLVPSWMQSPPVLFRVGDRVAYYSVIGDKEPMHVGVVHTVLPDGIPSCEKPMVMIEGKAGVVLASHCRLVGAAA